MWERSLWGHIRRDQTLSLIAEISLLVLCAHKCSCRKVWGMSLTLKHWSVLHFQDLGSWDSCFLQVTAVGVAVWGWIFTDFSILERPVVMSYFPQSHFLSFSVLYFTCRIFVNCTIVALVLLVSVWSLWSEELESNQLNSGTINFSEKKLNI